MFYPLKRASHPSKRNCWRRNSLKVFLEPTTPIYIDSLVSGKWKALHHKNVPFGVRHPMAYTIYFSFSFPLSFSSVFPLLCLLSHLLVPFYLAESNFIRKRGLLFALNPFLFNSNRVILKANLLNKKNLKIFEWNFLCHFIG